MKYAISYAESRLIFCLAMHVIFVALRTKRAKHRLITKFCTAARRVTVVSRIGDQEVNQCTNFHISHVDQYVVTPIFEYLIGAGGVGIQLAYTFERAPSIKISIDLESINPI